MSEVMVDAAVYTLFGPKTAAFVVSCMIAVRLLACAVGPTLGGHMYEAGCWALPFFVCALVLVVDALLQLLCIMGERPFHYLSLILQRRLILRL